MPRKNLKFLRFVLIEHQVRTPLAVLVVLSAVLGAEAGVFSGQMKTLAELKSQLALKKQAVSAKSRRAGAAGWMFPTDGQFTLQGIVEMNGTIYAVINDRMFKTGDALAQYEVTGITSSTVVLKEKATQKSKTLYYK